LPVRSKRIKIILLEIIYGFLQVLGFNVNLGLDSDENKIATTQKIINEAASKKRSIGRLLGCSHVAVYQWIKRYGEKAHLTLPATEIEGVEMDEGHPLWVQKKRWLAVDCR
jgi:hypothetical protein